MSLPRLLAGGALRWASSLVLFGSVGLAACVLASLTILPGLWQDVPGLPAARAGGAGAALALLALLVQPAGYVSLLYLLVLPTGFVLLGHQVGVARALAYVAEGRSQQLAGALTTRSWPLLKSLADSRRVAVSGSKARAVLVSTEQGGARRKVLGWVLGAAKVPELVASTDFLAHAKEEPDAARQELEARIASAIREWTAASLFRPLVFALGALALLTWGLELWLGA